MTTKPGIEKILVEFQSKSLRSTRSLKEEVEVALSAIRQLLLKSLPEKRREFTKLNNQHMYIQGYNTARQEDIDVINKVCGGEK